MTLWKKTNPSLFCAAVAPLLIGASQLQAQDSGAQVQINVRSGAANAENLQQNVAVTVQAMNFTGQDLKTADHKAYSIWKLVSDKLASRGQLQVQSDVSRQTATANVSFSAWKDGEPFLKTGVPVPPAWTNISSGVRQVSGEVKNFEEIWETLSDAERDQPENKYAFIRFHDKVGGHDARNAWLCASVPYAVEKGTLKFPTALQPLFNELCLNSDARIFQMTFSPDDWGTADGKPPVFDGAPANWPTEVRARAVLTAPRFNGEFVALRFPFERICGIDALSNRTFSNSLIEAGWIDRSLIPPVPGLDINIVDAARSCNETMIKKIIPVTADALRYFAMKGTFVQGNRWLNKRLRDLAEARRSEWLSGEKVAQELAADLTRELMVEKGYTNNQFVLARDLNIANAIEAANGFPALKGPSLVAKLFSVETDAQRNSPWRRELANLKQTYPNATAEELLQIRRGYDSRLVKLVTQACTDGEVELNCLAASLGMAESWENTPEVVLSLNDRPVTKKFGLLAPE